MTAYHVLFRVTARHGFYSDGTCSDFHYVPLGGTAELLRRYRLMLRNDETGVTVIYRSLSPSLQPIVSLDLPLEFAFGMQLRNPVFHQFTDLPNLPDLPAGEAGVYAHVPGVPAPPNVRPRIGGLVFGYESIGTSGNLARTERVLAGSSILVDLETTDTRVEFALTREATGNTLPSVVLANDTVIGVSVARARVQGTIPITGLRPGAYSLTYQTSAPERNVVTRYYLGAGSGPYFGIVLVTLRAEDAAIDPAVPRKHDIPFTTRGESIRYRVEALGSDYAPHDLEVTDESSEGPAITFTSASDDSDLPDRRVWTFTSHQQLGFRERPIKTFALSRATEHGSGGGGGAGHADPIIPALPLPSAGNAGQEITIVLRSPVDAT